MTNEEAHTTIVEEIEKGASFEVKHDNSCASVWWQNECDCGAKARQAIFLQAINMVFNQPVKEQ